MPWCNRIEEHQEVIYGYVEINEQLELQMITLIRNILAWFLSQLLIHFGFVSRAKKRALEGEYILSIYFHDPTKAEFESCVKWLIQNKFCFLKDSDLDDIAQQRVPFPKGAVFLSVDDGWLSNESNIVEVAKKYNVPVTIFVSTEPVETGVYWWSYLDEARRLKIKIPKMKVLKRIPDEERIQLVNDIKKKVSMEREAMSIRQVKRISQVEEITVGGHTHSHPILPNCEDDMAFKELEVSKKKLENWTGRRIKLFAYPNGDYGVREVELLKKLDYRYGFTNQPNYLTREHFKDPYTIPRFGFLEGATFAENICRMVGLWQPMMRKTTYPFRRNRKNNKRTG